MIWRPTGVKQRKRCESTLLAPLGRHLVDLVDFSRLWQILADFRHLGLWVGAASVGPHPVQLIRIDGHTSTTRIL